LTSHNEIAILIVESVKNIKVACVQEYLRQRMRFTVAASNGMDHVQLVGSSNLLFC